MGGWVRAEEEAMSQSGGGEEGAQGPHAAPPHHLVPALGPRRHSFCFSSFGFGRGVTRLEKSEPLT